LQEDQRLPRRPRAVPAREAEEHAGRRRQQPPRELARPLRLADGRFQRPQPQALPAVRRGPCGRTAEGRRAHPSQRRDADGQRHADDGACARLRRHAEFRRQQRGDGSEHGRAAGCHDRLEGVEGCRAGRQASLTRAREMRQSWIRGVTLGALVLALGLGVLLKAAPSSSPVADAAQNGDKEAVRTLLKQAADVNAAQPDGMTALHWAAMRNDAELAQTLLYAGANVKATTRINGYTPLLLATKNGNAAVVEPLIKGGAEVNAPTANGTTPLMFAAAAG